jgi:hypothetical protein
LGLGLLQPAGHVDGLLLLLLRLLLWHHSLVGALQGGSRLRWPLLLLGWWLLLQGRLLLLGLGQLLLGR